MIQQQYNIFLPVNYLLILLNRSWTCICLFNIFIRCTDKEIKGMSSLSAKSVNQRPAMSNGTERSVIEADVGEVEIRRAVTW